MREPLLMALDGDEGSVGSEDTTNCSLSDFGDFDSRGPAERREPLGGGSYVVDEAEVCGCGSQPIIGATAVFWTAVGLGCGGRVLFCYGAELGLLEVLRCTVEHGWSY